MTEADLKASLLGRFDKTEMVAVVNSEPAAFAHILSWALEAPPPLGWRAAWVLFHAMDKADKRLQPHVPALTAAIAGKADGHQRELLRILEGLEFAEEDEGQVFDACMNIWEQVGKIPSVRIFAFRILHRIASRYPELLAELTFLTQSQYTDTLSPGIRNSLERLCTKSPKGR